MAMLAFSYKYYDFLSTHEPKNSEQFFAGKLVVVLFLTSQCPVFNQTTSFFCR